jgi:hypothetical protein
MTRSASASRAPPSRSAAPDVDERHVVPLHQRWWDIGFLAFWVLNLVVITYIVDIEQITFPTNPDPGACATPSKVCCDLWACRWLDLLRFAPTLPRAVVWRLA